MPKVRKGPSGPRRSLAGKKGTNKSTPGGGASKSPVDSSSLKHNKTLYGK
jgi:hypothetical protein